MTLTPETLADIASASARFAVVVTEPDPHAARRSLAKIGSVAATERPTDRPAGTLSFSYDPDRDLPVETVQFETHPDFQRQHVALLMANTLRLHYGVAALRGSPAPPTPQGAALLGSLRRCGIMTPDD